MLLDRDIITARASSGFKNSILLHLSTDGGKTTEFEIDPSSDKLTFTVTPADQFEGGPVGLFSSLVQSTAAHINADFPDDFDTMGTELGKIEEGKITIAVEPIEFIDTDNATGTPGKWMYLSSLLATIHRPKHIGFEPREGGTVFVDPSSVPIFIDDVQYASMFDVIWFFSSRDGIKMTPHYLGTNLTKLVLETDE